MFDFDEDDDTKTETPKKAKGTERSLSNPEGQTKTTVSGRESRDLQTKPAAVGRDTQNKATASARESRDNQTKATVTTRESQAKATTPGRETSDNQIKATTALRETRERLAKAAATTRETHETTRETRETTRETRETRAKAAAASSPESRVDNDSPTTRSASLTATQQLEQIKANQPSNQTAVSPRHMQTRSSSSAAAAAAATTTPTIRTRSQSARKEDIYDFQPSPSPSERSPGRSQPARRGRGRGRGRAGSRGRSAGRGRGGAAAKEDTPEPVPGAVDTQVEVPSSQAIPVSQPVSETTSTLAKSDQSIPSSSAPVSTSAVTNVTTVSPSQVSLSTKPVQVTTAMTSSTAKTVPTTFSMAISKVEIKPIPVTASSGKVINPSHVSGILASSAYQSTVRAMTTVTTTATTLASKVQVTSAVSQLATASKVQVSAAMPLSGKPPAGKLPAGMPPTGMPPQVSPVSQPVIQTPGHVVPTTTHPRTTSATATSQIMTVTCTSHPISATASLAVASAPQRFPVSVQQPQGVSVTMPAVVKALGTPSVPQRMPHSQAKGPVTVGAMVAAQAAAAQAAAAQAAAAQVTQVIPAPKTTPGPGRPTKRGRRRRESTEQEKWLAHTQAMALQAKQAQPIRPNQMSPQFQQQLQQQQLQQQQQQQQQKMQQQQQQQLTPQQIQHQQELEERQRKLQALQEAHRQHQQKEQQMHRQQKQQQQQVQLQQQFQQHQNIRQHPPTTIAPQMRQLISQESAAAAAAAAAKAGAQAGQLHPHAAQPHVRVSQRNDAMIKLEQTSPKRTPEVQTLRPTSVSGPHPHHVSTIVSSGHGITPSSVAHGHIPTSHMSQLKPGQHTSGILVIASSAATKPLTTMAGNTAATMTSASQPTSSATVIAAANNKNFKYMPFNVPTSVAAEVYPDNASVLRARLTGNDNKAVLPPKKEKLEQLANMVPAGMAAHQLGDAKSAPPPRSQMSPMGMPESQKVAHVELQRLQAVTPGARTPGPPGKPEETSEKKRTQSDPGTLQPGEQWPHPQEHMQGGAAFRTPAGKVIYVNPGMQGVRPTTPSSQGQMVLSTDMVYPGMHPQYYLDPKQAEKIPSGKTQAPIAGMISPESVKSSGQAGQVYFQPGLIPSRYGMMFPGLEGQPLAAQGGRIASPNLPPPGASSPAVSPRVKSPAVVHAEHPHPSVTPEKLDISKPDQHQMMQQPGITSGIPPQRAPGITSGIPPQVHQGMPQLVMRKPGGYGVEARVHRGSKPEEQHSPRGEGADKQAHMMQDAIHRRTPVVADMYPQRHMEVPHMPGHSEQDPATPRAPSREYQPAGVPREPHGTWPAQGTPSAGISPHTPVGVHHPGQPLSPMPSKPPDSLVGLLRVSCIFYAFTNILHTL